MAKSSAINAGNDEVPGRVEQIICQTCLNNEKRTTAEKFCATCDEFQCLDCSNVHYTHNFFKNHKLVNANEAKIIQSLFDMKGLDQCDQHQEVLKFFCEDDNHLCCSTCAILYHRKCQSILEIQKVAKRVFLKSSQLKNRFENVRQKTEIIGNIIVSSKEKLGKDVKQIPVKIRQMRDKEMKMFDELKISVVKDVESFKKETLENLTIKQSRTKKYLADITTCLETINNVYQNGTVVQRFIAEQKMKNDVNVLHRNVNAECQGLETVTATFEFDETLKLPPLPITDYIPGKLTLTSCVSKAARSTTLEQPFLEEQKVKTDDRVPYKNVVPECQGLETETPTFEFDEKLKLPPRPVPDCAPGQLTLTSCVSNAVKATTPVSKVIKLTQIGSIDLRLSKGDINKPFYCGIDLLPDGRLVAVDSKNKKFLVYNEELNKVWSYKLSYSPYSVVAVSDEEVAITTSSVCKLYILRVNKSNDINLYRTYKVKKRYDSISVKDDEHFVCGTVAHSKPVRIVSFNGKEKDFKVSFPKKKYPIWDSACTYIRSSDKVVLTDFDEHAVYIYDVKTNTRVVVKDNQIKEPRGVAVGPYDTILVCCMGTHAVVQISQTGQILSSYKPDMENPVRVCVSRDKSFLIITNARADKKKILKLKISY